MAGAGGLAEVSPPVGVRTSASSLPGGLATHVFFLQTSTFSKASYYSHRQMCVFIPSNTHEKYMYI